MIPAPAVVVTDAQIQSALPFPLVNATILSGTGPVTRQQNGSFEVLQRDFFSAPGESILCSDGKFRIPPPPTPTGIVPFSGGGLGVNLYGLSAPDEILQYEKNTSSPGPVPDTVGEIDDVVVAATVSIGIVANEPASAPDTGNFISRANSSMTDPFDIMRFPRSLLTSPGPVLPFVTPFGTVQVSTQQGTPPAYNTTFSFPLSQVAFISPFAPEVSLPSFGAPGDQNAITVKALLQDAGTTDWLGNQGSTSGSDWIWGAAFEVSFDDSSEQFTVTTSGTVIQLGGTSGNITLLLVFVKTG